MYFPFKKKPHLSNRLPPPKKQFETFLNCRHTLYELDPHADFSATGLHFDTRTLDICASLDGDNQRIMHVCSNCEPTVSVDFTLTMRRPVTSCRQHEGEAGAQLERPVGTGWRTPWRDLLTAGTPAQREWEPAVQKYTNVAAVELRAGRGEWFRPFVGYALYNAWHEVRVQGGYQQRGGYVFWEVKATAPAFLREMDEMEAVLDRGDPWDELDYLVKGKGKGKGKGKEKVMMDLKTKLAKKARGNSRRFSGTRSLPMDTPSTKPMDEYSWGHLEELFGKF